MEPVERLASKLLMEGVVVKISDWIDHDGKGMPVSGNTFVLCRFRDGVEEDEIDFLEEFEDSAEFWNGDGWRVNLWKHSGGSSDIIAYRIVNP